VNTFQQPSTEPWLITLAASAGGIEAVRTILRALPPDLPAAVVVLQHRTPRAEPNHLRDVLGRSSTLPVEMAESGELIQPGRVYLARSDSHLTVSAGRRFTYVDGRQIRFLFSSANPLLQSAAAAFTQHLVAVVLTGGGSDATDGVQTVKAHGGCVIAQDPATAEHRYMPAAAVQSGAVDYVLPLEKIGPALEAIVRGRPIDSLPGSGLVA
jgi:two-component system chemotaxis response regulator CheB